MRGRSIGPTGRKKESIGATGPSFYKERLGTGSPPHPSPSVTASPQGEASGLCSPTRKSVPNQGTYMGTVIAPRSEQCGTTAKTSEWERAGHKPGGPGGLPPALFLPISREKWGPRRAGGPPGRCAPRHRKSPDRPKGTQCRPAPPPGTGREPTPQVPTCGGPEGTTYRQQRPPAPPGRPRRAQPCAGPEGTPSLPKRTPSRWAAWGPFHVCGTVVAGGIQNPHPWSQAKRRTLLASTWPPPS